MRLPRISRRLRTNLPPAAAAAIALTVAAAMALVQDDPPALPEPVPAVALPEPAPPPDPIPEPDPAADVLRVTVGRDDNLALLFSRHGLPAADLQNILDSGPPADRLTRVFPGQEVVFELGGDGELLRLSLSPDPLETLEFRRAGRGFEGREIVRDPERREAVHGAAIDDSLFLAAARAGLDDEVALRLTDIFKWDVDFITEVRPGDSFRVLIEERYLDGGFIDFGKILAAEFVNRGEEIVAVRYVDGGGKADFYTPDGRNMRKSFLRAPLQFTRVSSRFDPRRVHPLWKSAMPHRGIDYAAPTGTAVKASGDGIVETAGRTVPNGNYVVLRHAGGIKTKYLHLQRIGRGIRPGARVAQGDVIGRVGSTGWATGPHLHYEFLVDGVHRNPGTVELPPAEPVPDAERGLFLEQTRPLLEGLAMRGDATGAVALGAGE